MSLSTAAAQGSRPDARLEALHLDAALQGVRGARPREERGADVEIASGFAAISVASTSQLAQPDPPLEAQDPIVGEHQVAQIIGSGELGILADQVCLDDLTGRRTRDSYVDGDLGADDLVL